MIKRGKLFYSILLVIFTVFISISSHVYAQERFQLLFTDSGTTYKFDSLRFNITSDEKDSLCLDSWLLFAFDSKGAAAYTANRQKYNLPINGYEKLDHSLQHWIFKASKSGNAMQKVISVIDYSYDGKVLTSFTDDNPKWQDIIPDSIAEGVFLAQLNYVMANIQKPKE